MAKGALTKEERQQILAMAGKHTQEEIAVRLERKVETIKKFLDENWIPPGTAPGEEGQKAIIRRELRDQQEWLRLQQEFSKEELKYFEEKYVKLMKQFKTDVLPSEETQIFQAIKLEVLMSRNLIARKIAVDEIEKFQEMSKKFLSSFDGDPGKMEDGDRQFLMGIENQMAAAKNAEAARTNEYVRLSSEHAKLMDKLKASRDQRVKDIESGKVSFIGLIKSYQQKQQAEKDGREADLFRMARDKEYKRLSSPHKYADGEVDLPVLSHETLEDLGTEGEIDG